MGITKIIGTSNNIHLFSVDVKKVRIAETAIQKNFLTLVKKQLFSMEYCENFYNIKPFVSIALFLYPWCFHVAEKGCIGNEWVK